MSFYEIRNRIIKRWLMVLIITVLFIISFLPWSNSKTFQASITLGLSLNSVEFSSKSGILASGDVSKSLAYSQIIKDFTIYLESRFKSVEIQKIISDAMDTTLKSYSEKTPPYSVTPVGLGFVTVSLIEITTVDEAEKFLVGVKTAYETIVGEWNESRLSEYKILKMDNFNSVVIENEKPLQIQLFPVVSGWLIGLVLAASFPLKDKKI